MKPKRIFVTERDRERLKCLVGAYKELWDRKALLKLETLLEQARVVESREVPDSVVTMNCLVELLDLDTSEKKDRWLRFSTGKESSSRVVPILSDLGVTLLGSNEGDTIEWSEPSGKKKGKILTIVYQPERLGNYEL
jgi:regulator of nucleoside diphosphate kinase